MYSFKTSNCKQIILESITFTWVTEVNPVVILDLKNTRNISIKINLLVSNSWVTVWIKQVMMPNK